MAGIYFSFAAGGKFIFVYFMNRLYQILYTMKKLLVALLFVFSVACDSQTKKNTKPEIKNKISSETLGTNPKVQVNVNRKYDNKGNLIRFDSTYSYFYSTRGLDSTRTSVDTAFRNFRNTFPFKWQNEFNSIFIIYG
jgi:hypothetical protein